MIVRWRLGRGAAGRRAPRETGPVLVVIGVPGDGVFEVLPQHFLGALAHGDDGTGRAAVMDVSRRRAGPPVPMGRTAREPARGPGASRGAGPGHGRGGPVRAFQVGEQTFDVGDQ